MGNIGARIRELRKGVGLSQRQLAARVQVSFSHMSKIETGADTASDDLLMRVANELGADPDELLLSAGRIPASLLPRLFDDPRSVLQFFGRGQDAQTAPLRPAGRPRRIAASDRDRMVVAPTEAVMRPPKTAESVARLIIHDIVERNARPGDRLASEADMVEELGVSRGSLREALRLLEVQGLIALRRGPGGGPVVEPVDPANLGRTSTLFYHLAGASYDELFEAWKVVEATLAELSARNHDRHERERLMAPYLQPNKPSRPSGDRTPVLPGLGHARFHWALAVLSGNRVLELMLQTPGLILTHHLVASTASDMLDRIAEEHANIARAVVQARPRQARALMVEHIQWLSEFYREHGEIHGEANIDWR
jgi:GntR family transcriptional repressor for pyruvate dehydrogenase complex